MSLLGRIEELTRRHQKLDTEIRDEQKRPMSDPTALRSLKREKLRLKEKISTLRTA